MYPHEPYSGHHPAPYWLRDDCHSKHYREPDMNGFSCDDMLPMISSIGRGPKGAGVTATILKNTATDFMFALINDETGEQFFQSPNLAPTIVSVTAPDHDPVPGEAYPITFHMRRGTDIEEYTVEMPPGATGSLIYCLEDPIKFKVPPDVESDKPQRETNMWTEFGKLYDETFVTTVDHLLIYGRADWKGKPFPRVNDIIFCPYYAESQTGYSIGVSFGTIEAVENGTVVWTARTFVPSSDLKLSEKGTWVINGKDSGFVSKGEKGDKGDTGETGKAPEMQIGYVYNSLTASADVRLVNKALNRYALDLWLPQGARGPRGYQGADGKDGENGLPATIEIGDVKETLQPYAQLRQVSLALNKWKLDLGLPRGADGKSINIQGGIYEIEDLPDFDTTPVNDAFIVDDGDNRFDLYIRGFYPVMAEDGGPWTVVENWQGIQGYGIRWLQEPYYLSDEPLHIPVNRVDFMLTPSLNVIDGDLVIDSDFCLGVISSSRDHSGDYVVTRLTSRMQETITKIEERIEKVEQALLERATDEDIDKWFDDDDPSGGKCCCVHATDNDIDLIFGEGTPDPEPDPSEPDQPENPGGDGEGCECGCTTATDEDIDRIFDEI